MLRHINNIKVVTSMMPFSPL